MANGGARSATLIRGSGRSRERADATRPCLCPTPKPATFLAVLAPPHVAIGSDNSDDDQEVPLLPPRLGHHRASTSSPLPSAGALGGGAIAD